MRYQVIMSAGEPITIEQDEIEKVLSAINQKAIVVCHQGIINPSHFVSIVGEKSEWEGTNIPIAERPPSKPLKDIFADVRQRLLK